MSDPLICAFTPTCNRPELLSRMIACFEKQTYQNRHLIILDDLGQYENQQGDRWELISIPRRILSLGEKNNCCLAMAPRETWGYAKMDDDDVYLPWHLEAIAGALHRGPFVQPLRAIDYIDGKCVVVDTFGKDPTKGAYHGCWGFTRDLIERTGGYRPEYAGDDQEFQKRLNQQSITSVDTNCLYKPSYFYNRPLPGRISEAGGSAQAYWNMGSDRWHYVGKLPPWTGEEVWNWPVPTEHVKRPW